MLAKLSVILLIKYFILFVGWDYSDEYNAMWMLEKSAQSLELRTLQSEQSLRKSYRWKLSNLGSISSAAVQPESEKYIEEMLHVCSSCGKRYKWMDSLRRHKRVECGKIANTGCPYCHYRTKHRSNMYLHIKTQHKGQKVYAVDLKSDR